MLGPVSLDTEVDRCSGRQADTGDAAGHYMTDNRFGHCAFLPVDRLASSPWGICSLRNAPVDETRFDREPDFGGCPQLYMAGRAA
jgi:hypothetical protein